jgi:hypothetical protein
MTNIDIRYAVIGTNNSINETGFIYIDRGCHDYSYSNEPNAIVTQIPNDKTLHYSIYSCKNVLEFIKTNIPSKFSNLKIVAIETTYDFANIRITTKLFEVMDNDELVELGKECE